MGRKIIQHPEFTWFFFKSRGSHGDSLTQAISLLLIRGEGILEYPDVGAEDANQDATRTPQGCRTNATGMPLGCR